MNFFRGRGTFVLISAFLLFCFLGRTRFSPSFSLFLGLILLILGSASLFLLAFIKKFKMRARLWLSERRRIIVYSSLSLVFAALGVLFSYVAVYLPLHNCERYNGTERELSFAVFDRIYENEYLSCYGMKVLSAEDEELVGKRMLLFCGERLDIGEEYIGACRLSALEDTETFEEKSYYTSVGYSLAASGNDFEHIGSAEDIEAQIWHFRERIDGKFRELSEKAGPYLSAVLTGEREGMSERDKMYFTYSGTTHLLAISGMHLSLIILAVTLFCRALSLSKRWITYISIILSALYCGLSGFAFSLIRAAVMVLFSSLAYLLSRERDSYTALALSAFLIILAAPYSITNLGLWLSLFATFGILLYVDILEKREKKKEEEEETEGKGKGVAFRLLSALIHYIGASLAMSFFALLFTLPISAVSFGTVSPVSPLSTLLLMPFVNFLIIIAPMLLLLPSDITAPLVFLSEKAVDVIIAINRRLANISGSLIIIDESALKVLIPLFLIFMLFVLFANIKSRKRVSVLFILFAMVCCVIIYGASYFEIRRMPVAAALDGRKDTVAINTEGGAVVFSHSPSYHSSVQVSNALLKLQSSELEAFVLSCYGKSGEETLMLLPNYTIVRNVYIPKPSSYQEQRLADGVREYYKNSGLDIEIHYYEYLRTFSCAGAAITVSSPYAGNGSSVPSLSVSLEYKGRKTVYLSSGIALDPYFPRAVKDAGEADCVIIGSAGPKNKAPITLRVPDHCTVIYSEEAKDSLVLSGNNGDLSTDPVCCESAAKVYLAKATN